jgi:murein DD-endopeptidase MepM/ murein hydrolase activator NlpD
VVGRRKAGLLRSSLVVYVGALLVCLGLVACGGGNENPAPSESDVVVASVSPRPTPTPELVRFAFPIAGGCLPVGDQLMPNAPRAYRDGIHEGVDFYDVDNCTTIGEGTEVLAAKAGEVIRADWDYEELTAEELDEILQRIKDQGCCDEEALDRFRGRQVWIDHGGGVMTRYAHLSEVAEGVRVGTSVRQGQVIGYVGNSGTPESVTSPGAEMHLHFEIRVGDGYLGQGLPADEVRGLYEKAFAP